ncbi:unnamed protein product [Closterium sp. Yama58-4]|nr:unnamed protein product [Closterium sp. Yama58-4]
MSPNHSGPPDAKSCWADDLGDPAWPSADGTRLHLGHLRTRHHLSQSSSVNHNLVFNSSSGAARTSEGLEASQGHDGAATTSSRRDLLVIAARCAGFVEGRPRVLSPFPFRLSLCLVSSDQWRRSTTDGRSWLEERNQGFRGGEAAGVITFSLLSLSLSCLLGSMEEEHNGREVVAGGTKPRSIEEEHNGREVVAGSTKPRCAGFVEGKPLELSPFLPLLPFQVMAEEPKNGKARHCSSRHGTSEE